MDESIKKSTQLAFDEINALSETDLTKDDVLSLLVNGYKLGVDNTAHMLDYPVDIDIEDMYEALYVLIDDKTWADRYDAHKIEHDISGMKTLVESEYHRVYNMGSKFAAERIGQQSGGSIEKTWLTMLDNRVRQTHEYLEGMTIPLNDEFFTYDGDHAYSPGLFGNAENNVNCRCILSYSWTGKS